MSVRVCGRVCECGGRRMGECGGSVCEWRVRGEHVRIMCHGVGHTRAYTHTHTH